MKRGHDTTLSSPISGSGANGPMMGNSCPREFLTTIPHPIPRGMGLSSHCTRALQANLARGDLAKRGSLPEGLTEACAPEEESWKRLRSQCPHWMEKAKGQENGATAGRVDLSGRLGGRAAPMDSGSKNEVKRIWPVMGFGKLEIRELDTAYIVNLDIPGVSKDTIDVSLRPTSILVECIREPIPVVKNRFRYIERPSGKLVRTIQLPAKANPDAIRCTYMDGVLSFSIAKLSDKEVNRKVNVG